MADIFGISADQADRLRRMLNEFESGALTRRQNDSHDPRWLEVDHVVVGYLDSAITGIANLNSNPNVGTLSVYSFTSTGQTDTGTNETVYHFATADATTDRWTHAKRDRTTGKYVLDFQACSTT